MRKRAFQTVLELARANPRVLLAVSDVSANIIADFQREMPERLFLEGVAEGHLIGMAAGLAHEGNIVFVNTIASFLTKRCFEQIAINVCLENADVKLLGQGGGLLYGRLGPTHHANEDLAILRTLPQMNIVVPFDVEQTQAAIAYAAQTPGPFYVRLGKGNVPVVSRDHPFEFGKPVVLKAPQGGPLLVAQGPLVSIALEAAQAIPDAGVVGIHTLKPFAHAELAPLLDSVPTVATIEEHSEVGGLSALVCETLARHCRTKPALKTFSLKDEFIHQYGKQEELLKLQGLDADAIVRALQ